MPLIPMSPIVQEISNEVMHWNMQSRKEKKNPRVGSSNFWPAFAVNALFGRVQQGCCCCCIYFQKKNRSAHGERAKADLLHLQTEGKQSHSLMVSETMVCYRK